MMLSFFFFSSRRRHTRSLCDWSSDVCSSDLKAVGPRSRATMQWSVHACMLLVAGFMLVYGAHLCVVTWGNTIAEFPSLSTRSEEHTSELQSHSDLVCRLLLEKKKKNIKTKQY